MAERAWRDNISDLPLPLRRVYEVMRSKFPSEKQAADALGVGRSTLSKIFAGNRKKINWELCCALLEKCGVREEDVFSSASGDVISLDGVSAVDRAVIQAVVEKFGAKAPDAAPLKKTLAETLTDAEAEQLARICVAQSMCHDGVASELLIRVARQATEGRPAVQAKVGVKKAS